jgi:chemotaxis protein methyltransferase CheR
MRSGDARGDDPRQPPPPGRRPIADVARSILSPLPLAHGDLSAADSRQLTALKRQIHDQVGFFCEGYKEKCLRRRLAVRMRARGIHGYGDYAALLDEDPEEYARLLAAITINVSKFFRNIEVWTALRDQVLGELFELNVARVRVWSAGSAAGEEAYTLAILLRELAESRGLEAQLARFRLLGTDIDRDVLEAARRAEYPELALAETPAAVRERWFEERPPLACLRPEIRAMVEFRQGDLIRDALPAGQHLILCRNVIIYFDRPIQERLFERFHDALEPGGLLVLGKVETLFGPAARGFRAVANAERIFRKL